jgi:hypothetical protein
MLPKRSNPILNPACGKVREQFTPYLDGRITGVEMATVATHLDTCRGCALEFDGLRAMQQALGQLGPAAAPARLQSRLRETIRAEFERGTHLSWTARLSKVFAAYAFQMAGGLGLAVVVLGGLTWLFGAPLAAVNASDDRMTHLIAPQYLYSQVPPQPIATQNDVPILVDALVDAHGRVYDYHILTGPADPQVRARVEENLLDSVFRPATVFGTPVNGHVMLTYMGVSVRG